MSNKSNDLQKLTVLKVGGSLITNKSGSFESNIESIKRISKEISSYIEIKQPNERLIITHGQGSYGHSVAINQMTRLHSIEELDYGLLLIMWAARALNSLVVEGLVNYGVKVFPIQTSIGFELANGHISLPASRVISKMIERDWIPVFYGDILVDTVTSETQVFSSESIIYELCKHYLVSRVIISTDKPGVLKDILDPKSTIETISKRNIKEFEKLISGSSYTDVTGGMKHKVETLLTLYREKKIKSYIIDGTVENAVLNSLLNIKYIGTKIGE